MNNTLNVKQSAVVLLAALFVLAVFAVTMTSTCLNEITAPARDQGDNSMINAEASILCGGDPVPGGGWPNGGNQTG